MADYVLNNRYRLLAQVASGGMAVVYKAHDLTLNRVVAVKILRENFADDSGFRARFQSEAQAAANLAHPNIVTVYDYGQDGNRAYIVMEFVEGRDLKSVIRAESPLPMDRAIDLMAQACAALGHAHRAGLVHCDVKPQNLIVTPDGRLKVTDFGIARAISQSMPQNVETVWGTPHYFSPEQAAGEAPTPASDVYSLGVVMYEMLSGQLPFDADNHTDLAMQHLQDQPPPLTALNPAVPIQIEQIINRVMAKDPAARYRTAEQFGRALMDYRRLADQMTGLQNAVPINVGSNSTTVGAAARPIVPATSTAPTGTDWLGWILGALAAIAVIGLIPLLFLVIRAYSSPPPAEAGALTPGPASAPTAVGNATLPPFAEQVLIPKLIGLTQKDAEQLAGTTGLQLVIGPGRFDAQIPSGAVAAQNPPAGRRVARNSPVEINLSQGPQISPMINVLNFTYEEVEAGLKPYGWDIRLVEEYSQQPYHLILKQEPPAGLPLGAVALVFALGYEIIWLWRNRRAQPPQHRAAVQCFPRDHPHLAATSGGFRNCPLRAWNGRLCTISCTSVWNRYPDCSILLTISRTSNGSYDSKPRPSAYVSICSTVPRTNWRRLSSSVRPAHAASTGSHAARSPPLTPWAAASAASSLAAARMLASALAARSSVP